MSVIVKGMKMPHRCSDCTFYNADYCMQNNIGRRECALVELPEKHGRLIDVGVLKKAILKWMPDDPCGSQEKEFLFSADFAADICTSVMMEIEEAPIVVEAEGE